jgi:ribosomal protein S18 acetylase RimI-like enzyme
MSDFYISLSDSEIAKQIAMLLNANNNLYVKHDAFSIKSGKTNYFVEVDLVAKGKSQVVACVGLLKEFEHLSKIYHVCTHPNYRRLGLAKKLVNLAVQNCETSHVYMTIREDNVPSINMALSLNFNILDKKWSKDHMILIAGRRVMLCPSKQKATV